MQRRDFLRGAAAAGAMIPLASSGLFARPLTHAFFPRPAALGDRVLVLVNLNGGNDGLNTIVPIEDPLYYGARRNLAIPPGDALRIADGLGLHPAMARIRQLYEAGDCAIVQSVGYPNQDRSHFRSTDIWHTASDADVISSTGWLGRYLEAVHPEYPDTLPAAPFAMQIGSSVTLALQGEQGNAGIAIDNPDRFYNLARGLEVPEDPLPPGLAGPELAYVRAVIAQSGAFSTAIQRAMELGSTNVTYDADILSLQLRVVARLINGGLDTGVYVVTLGGFDTHQGQLARHAQLLTQLTSAVATFLADVSAAGNGHRVAMATYSEFGRRVAENGSAGTDHGAAAPLFVFGQPVLGGQILGGIPDLENLDTRGDISFIHDFRQVYTTILEDWLGVSSSDARSLLGGTYTKLPLFSTSSAPIYPAAASGVLRLEQASPNPTRATTVLMLKSIRDLRIDIDIAAPTGARVAERRSMQLREGVNQIVIDLSRLPAGNYSVVMSSAEGNAVARVVKL